MPLIGISGAQGAGKGTVLSSLAERHWKVDTFKVSRAVQETLGWDNLDKVYDSFDTMRQFQDEIFNQKLKSDLALSAKSEIILTERTFADIAAYASFWTWELVQLGKVEMEDASTFLSNFTRYCANAQYDVYAGTVLIPLMPHMRQIVIDEADAHRADVKSADTIFDDAERFLETYVPYKPRLRVSSETVQDRVIEIERFLTTQFKR